MSIEASAGLLVLLVELTAGIQVLKNGVSFISSLQNMDLPSLIDQHKFDTRE